MNIKSIFFITALIISTSTRAQNLTLAKAFFKKAQQEYSKKNYTKVFKLLDKAKEQLGGDTNAQIIYLEAKAHYNSDINVNKAKKLLTLFLEKAEPNDSRIDEISSIIVDIEVSDKIDKNGDFKDIRGRSGIKISYYDSGEKKWEYNYVNGVRNGPIKGYNKQGILIKSGTIVNGNLEGFYEWFKITKNGSRYRNQTNIYKGNKKNGEEKRFNEKGKLTAIYMYANGKKNGLYKSFNKGKLSVKGNYENDKMKGKWIYYYDNGKISTIYNYNNTPSYDPKKRSFIEGIRTGYFYDGIKEYEENYVKGKKQGAQKYYHENGYLQRWEHIGTDGKLYGQRAFYFKLNGKRHINIAYENGKAMTLLEQVDINGKKLKISKLKKGQGYIKRANAAGVIIYEATIENGYKDGVVKSYYDSGKLYRTEYYKAGKLINETKTYYEDGSIQSTFDYNKKRINYNYKTYQTNALLKLVNNNKSIDDIIAYCKTKNPMGQDFYLAEETINRLGYHYLTTKKNAADALKIFKLNIEFYPNAWNTYDSYGECLVELGRTKEGITAYKKSLALNPKNTSAIDALKKLE
jgi:antitoxin component YwqK of YwqJK toxin-antitoxin module